MLEERLEHGRIGVVYKALDKQRTDPWGERQHVALLVVPPHAVRGAGLLEPFKHAFAAVRMLRHPRIAAVYDFETAGETFFLTMEYVDGETLRSVMDMLIPETLSRDDAWRVIASIGEALLHAHSAGVVHGDVRAENVIVAPRGQVKVLFTPACLAASAPFPADEREDVYGLAELAYELLAGQKPPADALLRSRRRIHTERIEGLSRGRWKALQAGLAGRDERTRSIEQLLAGLEVRRNARKWRADAGERHEHTSARREPVRSPAPNRPMAPPVERVVLPPRNRIGARIEESFVEPAAPSRLRRTDRPSGGARIARRAVMALIIMASVLAASVALLRYGPAEMERRGAAMSVAALDALDRHLVAPASRRISALVRAARERAAADSAGDRGAALEEAAPAAAERRSAEEARAGAAESAPLEDTATAGGAGEASTQGAPLPARSGGLPTTPAPAEGSRDDAPGGRSDGTLRSGGSDGSVRGERSRGGVRDERSEQGAAAPPRAEADRATPRRAEAGRSDDPAAFFVEREITASEGQTVVPVEIRRGDASAQSAVLWWTADGTATAGNDYADLGSVIESFAPGEAARTVFIPITNDSLPERRESFVVYLAPPSADGRPRNEPQSARITIVDDDF
ncbi:MAG TPA: Calx-beta domain-containing protein [Gammaproteobacteria bacterium]